MFLKMRNRTGILQRDETDCGPACIASVMAHYGIHFPVALIRQVAGTDPEGTSMLGMIKALNHFNFEARGLKGNAEHLGKLPHPFIAHIKRSNLASHYVCVFGISRRGYLVMDPSEGRKARWSHDAFRKCWSGAVIALIPGAATRFPKPGLTTRSRFTLLLRPVWKPALRALTSAILYTILGLSSSIYVGKLTDHVFVTHSVGLLNLMSLAMVGITLLVVYFSVSKNVIMLKTGQVIDNQLILSYFRHLFRLPQRFFDSMKTGEIISRVNDAVKILFRYHVPDSSPAGDDHAGHPSVVCVHLYSL